MRHLLMQHKVLAAGRQEFLQIVKFILVEHCAGFLVFPLNGQFIKKCSQQQGLQQTRQNISRPSFLRLIGWKCQRWQQRLLFSFIWSFATGPPSLVCNLSLCPLITRPSSGVFLLLSRSKISLHFSRIQKKFCRT